MADPGRSLCREGKILFLKPEGHIYEADQNRHFHKGSDYSGKGLTRVNPENSNGHGNSQFKLENLIFEIVSNFYIRICARTELFVQALIYSHPYRMPKM